MPMPGYMESLEYMISSHSQTVRREGVLLQHLASLYLDIDNVNWKKGYNKLTKAVNQTSFSRLSCKERSDYSRLCEETHNSICLKNKKGRKAMKLVSKVKEKVCSTEDSRLEEVLTLYDGSNKESRFIRDLAHTVYVDPMVVKGYRLARKVWKEYCVTLGKSLGCIETMSDNDIEEVLKTCDDVRKNEMYMSWGMKRKLKRVVKMVGKKAKKIRTKRARRRKFAKIVKAIKRFFGKNGKR